MQQEMKIRLSLITPYVAHIRNVNAMTINSSSGQSGSTATHQFLNSVLSDIGIVCSWTGLIRFAHRKMITEKLLLD